MSYQGTTNNNNEITEEGTTSSDNEITEEGAMDSSSTTSGSSSSYESAMDSLSTASGSNTNYEDHVTVFVAYNGRWVYDGKEWFFKNCRSSIIVVPKNITLPKITDNLHKQLKINQTFYRLKLEVHYRTGSPWFPVTEIQNNQDLSVFISETSKTKLPLCVTQLDVRFKDDVHAKLIYKVDRVKDRLIKAIRKSDWVKAREIVNTEDVSWLSKLDYINNTALHYAAGRYKDNEVVRDILFGINKELLVTTANANGAIPAHQAALYGNTEALKMMCVSNPKCLFIRDNFDTLPIQYANPITRRETFFYLFEQMKSYEFVFDMSLRSRIGILLNMAIQAGLIDVAYELVNEYPSMATSVYLENATSLGNIVVRPELYYSGTHYNLYQRFVYHHVPIENNSMGSTDTADVENQETPKKDTLFTKHERRCLHDVISWICVKLWKTTLLHVPHVKRLKDDKVKHNTTIMLLRRMCKEADKTYIESFIDRIYSSPYFIAVENNTVEPIDVLVTYFPQLIFSMKDGLSIIQLTVLNRSEKVYNYILHHVDEPKSRFIMFKDYYHNNILHLAGRLAPIHKLNAASGAALQMQRELQWFEEVKRVVGIPHAQALNRNKETPIMVFRREHKGLRKDGEEWMKKTADSYTITAALIITIVFAAAITVPGGNDDNGKPIYETKASLIIFAISDAISLFTSTTSLLLFLSILTARYADEDFLYKLPKRLIYGLVMLFVSVTSMMIAFSAALYIMFGQGKQWILIPIGALACLPIASFVTLQFPLLFELISSTYGPGMFGKKKEYRQSSANANKKKRT